MDDEADTRYGHAGLWPTRVSLALSFVTKKLLDHASDCSFPHVQWQPKVSQTRNWLSRGRLKVFTAPGFNRLMNSMVRNVFWRYYSVARTAIACDSHSPPCRLSVRKNSWRSRQQDFLGPSRAVDVLLRDYLFIAKEQ